MANRPDLASAWARLARWLTGTQPELLAQCSQSQRTLSQAMAIMMLVTALLTGVGVGGKLASIWDIAPGGALVLALPVTLLALAMEAAVLTSIAHGASAFATLAVRIPIGLMLVALQALPVLTTMLRPDIELALQERSIAQQLRLKDNVDDLVGLSRARSEALALESRHAQMAARQANPPADTGVVAAQAKRARAAASRARAENVMVAAHARVARLRQLPVRPADAERARLQMERAVHALDAARSVFSTATAAVGDADAVLAQARSARDEALARGVSEARDALDEHRKRVASAETLFAGQMEQGRKLATAASERAAITEVTTLLRLAATDWTVAVAVMATFLGFVLPDLMPTMLKVAARRGAYAQMEAAADELRVGEARRDLALASEEDAQLLLVKRNLTAGVERFTREDAGQSEATRMAMLRRSEREALESEAEVELLLGALDRVGEIREAIDAQEARGQDQPELLAAHREQLPAPRAAAGAHSPAPGVGASGGARLGEEPRPSGGREVRDGLHREAQVGPAHRIAVRRPVADVGDVPEILQRQRELELGPRVLRDAHELAEGRVVEQAVEAGRRARAT